MAITHKVRLAVLPFLVPVACSDPGYGVYDPPPTRAPATIRAASSTRVDAKAGAELDSALVVQVTDDAGRGLAGARVLWKVTSGSGQFIDADRIFHEPLVTRSDSAGLARVKFWPLVLGTTTVDVQVFGLDRSIMFTIVAGTVVIGNGFWGIFLAPDGADEVTVPVGTPIEWVNYWQTSAHITSVTAPRGGHSFDSGALLEGDRFRFVPDVVGTWEYVWYYDEWPDDRRTARITAVSAGP